MHHIENRTSKTWELEQIRISHNIIEYNSFGKVRSMNDSEYVRLHFGIKGSYQFSFSQLNASYDLSGHHNNIMYSDGLEIEVQNKSDRIETFGINFTPESYIAIAQNGNEAMKRFSEKVMNKENSIFSPTWKTNDFRLQQVIDEMIHCPYATELNGLFLLSKSIELLVIQAELYEKQSKKPFIKSAIDKRKLIEAKELLSSRIENPPTIVELSKLIGINEYKLKRGFKELFGTTVFGLIHRSRMSLAKRLLLDTEKTVKEVAYETGYSSPQHFSKAFRKEFSVSPNSIRMNPYSAIK
ncbi:helix-turn-helix transcriptional regulator [Fulvivirga sp. M361]|uniref:helix-turn-helix transcriptional regulator n=1 Tax=Fulvivirga sp. M361 TaxID=2594266 RepID=UPI0016298089|nr:AraC family transcriptional regulator [Fulvivirga sp. M361]